MIQDTLAFLGQEVNSYLSLKLGPTTLERVVLGNIAKATDAEGASNLQGVAVLSLVNVEEDRISKQQENYRKTPEGVRYQEPPVFVNLYILISVNKSEYEDSLHWLSLIIQYFQHKSVFTPEQYPQLESRGIEKIVVELHTLNFEQINHLWGTLGGKYLPSVLYKVKQVTLDENELQAEGALIRDIVVNDKHKKTVS